MLQYVEGVAQAHQVNSGGEHFQLCVLVSGIWLVKFVLGAFDWYVLCTTKHDKSLFIRQTLARHTCSVVSAAETKNVGHEGATEEA